MNKITAYISSGKGIGFSLLFVLALVFSLLSAWQIRSYGVMLTPYMQNIADQILPLKIENNKITYPADTVKSVRFEMGNLPGLPQPVFILNTKIDELNIADAVDGFYLTRSKFYIVQQGKTEIYPLTVGDAYFPRDNYRDMFNDLMTRVAIVSAVILLFFSFAFFALLTALGALLARGLNRLLKKQADFPLLMRCASLCLGASLLLFWLISSFGGAVSALGFMIFFLLLNILLSLQLVKKA